MSHPIRFGVLGAADVAIRRVVPAMQEATSVVVSAIASRDAGRAESVANALGIEHALGSYEKLIAHPAVDAVYVPLPNSLHAEWVIAAARGGKHVLCEKPLAMTADEGREIADAAADSGVLVMEAFMYRLHPQWTRARQLVTEGRIGEVRSVQVWFGYHNDDPDDIRNTPELGGGAVRDVGCYGINAARMLFGGDPISVDATLEVSPEFGTDTLASITLEFPEGHASIVCSTLSFTGQAVRVVGTRGQLDISTPFDVDPARSTNLRVETSSSVDVIHVPSANHFTIQAEEFARATEGAPPPVTLGNSIGNLAVIDRVLEAR